MTLLMVNYRAKMCPSMFGPIGRIAKCFFTIINQTPIGFIICMRSDVNFKILLARKHLFTAEHLQRKKNKMIILMNWIRGEKNEKQFESYLTGHFFGLSPECVRMWLINLYR